MKLEILFWKAIRIIWNTSPRMHLPKFKDYPIASTEIQDEYTYPEGIKVLFEWDEKGEHWIVFTR